MGISDTKTRRCCTYRNTKVFKKAFYNVLQSLGSYNHKQTYFLLLWPDKKNAYSDDILSKFQYDLCKGCSVRHFLFYMIEKIREIRDSKEAFAAVLTDLPKAFDCISHEELLAKLHGYVLDKILIFTYAYLCQRKQKIREGSTFRELMNISFCVLQRSILGPLLLMIYICDLFFLNDHLKFGSYA